MSQHGSDWWKKINGLSPRNPEVFKTDGGTIWTTAEKGNIFEDKYFYVPDKFDWLGGSFKNIKSLISGIGLKVTEVIGEKFNKDMNSISFKERRSGVAQKDSGSENDVFSRKVSFERVAYYKPNDKDIWELGNGVCVLRRNKEGQDIFLFVGFTEVEEGGNQGRGKEWHFKKGNFFKGGNGCGTLKSSGWDRFRLVPEKIGRSNAKDGFQGDQVIVLGVGTQAGEGIARFNQSGGKDPLIGVLMGVAVNLPQGSECKGAYGGGSGESDPKNNSWSKGMEGCVKSVKKRIKESESGGLKIEGWNGSEQTMVNEGEFKKRFTNSSIWESWVEYGINSWKDTAELKYQYK